MEIISYAIIFISMLISIILLDYIWLGKINNKFIVNQFNDLVETKNKSLKVNILPGLFAWILISIGSLFFVVLNVNTQVMALFMGGFFGFILYGVYEFTNLTFIKQYPKKFAFVDLIWGTILCSIISFIGFVIKTYLLS